MNRENLLRQGWVLSRARLHDLLSSGVQHPLISVVAGHGYGKTTAVAEFCKNTDRRLIWVHLQSIDSDPQRFWQRFLRVVGYEFSELAEQLSGLPFPDAPGFADVLARVIHEQGSDDRELLLVFDHFENIAGGAVREFIYGLVGLEPEHLCMILISNRPPFADDPLDSSKSFFIGVKDLAFNAEEITQLFSHYGRELQLSECRRLQKSTDGWPLALYLMASRSGEGVQPEYGEVSHLQTISSLFQRFYYDGYPADIRRALVILSLLPCVNNAIVRMLDVQLSGDLFAVLHQNAFVSYSFSRKIFFFQTMYHQFLRQQSELLEAQELTAIYTEAADCYSEQSFVRGALICYWSAQRYDRFLALLNPPPVRWVGVEYTDWVLDKLDRLPPEYGHQQDQIDYIRGLLYLNSAKSIRAKEQLTVLANRLSGLEQLTEEQSTLLGNTYAALMEVAILQNTHDGLAHAQRAIALIPQGANLRTEADMVAGNNDLFFLPDNRPAGLERTISFTAQMAIYSKILHHNSGRGYYELFRAEAYFLFGQPTQAWEQSVRTVHIARQARQHDIVANALFLQLRMALYSGEGDTAISTLSQLTSYVEENAPFELAELRDCARATYFLRMNEVEKVPLWLSGRGEMAGHALPGVGRDRFLCAKALYQAGEYKKSLAALLELEEFCSERRQWTIRLKAMLQKATCLLRLEEADRAVAQLHAACELTRANRILVPFLELGAELSDLLDAAAEQSVHRFDPEWVELLRQELAQYVFRDTVMRKKFGTTPQGKRKLPGKLTPREEEVFSYWVKGLSRDEIAAVLGLSIHGVKKHIASIYTKLEAVNRLDAIHIANAHGLLKDSIVNDIAGD